MGCWNATCMISNLPILSGEEVKLIILHNPYNKKNLLAKSSGYCNIYDLLKPAFFSIDGEYDEYGTIENIKEDFNFLSIFNYLKNVYPSIFIEEYNKVEEKKDWTMDDLISGIERGHLKDINYSFVLIRKDIWDFIIKNHKEEYSYDGLDLNDRCHKDFFEYIQTFKDIENLKNEKRFSEAMIKSFSLRDKINFQALNFKIIDEKILNNDEFQNSLFTSWKEMIIVESFLESIRKGWMIQAGAGSQSSKWNSYILLSSKINEICEEKINYEEENY